MNRNHLIHETRSLRMHGLIAEACLRDPKTVIHFARENLSRWRMSNVDCDDFAVWETILSGSQAGILHTLTSTDETSVRLRKSSPFAGMISAEDRNNILASLK